MKRIIAVLLAACVIFSFVGCNNNPSDSGTGGNNVLPEITMDEIEWSVAAGTVNGHPHVLLTVTNHSNLTLKYIKISFTEKDGVSQADKDKLYSDIQTTQKYDDEYMASFIANHKDKSITMYGYADDEIAPGETLDENKCYYFGGLTSKYVVYPDLFVPEIAEYKFDSNGIAYTVFYNFKFGTYEIDSEPIETEGNPSTVPSTTPTPPTESDPIGDTSDDFKATMDGYEAFIISYVDFMNAYLKASDPASMLDEYTKFMLQYAETMQKLSEIKVDELSADDYAYYVDVQARITAKLLEIGNPGSSDAVSPDFKATMDSYEAFITEYVDFMNQYLASDDPLSLLDEYTSYVQQYTETMQKISEINSDELSTADYAYYVEVQARISKKLLEIGAPSDNNNVPNNHPPKQDETNQSSQADSRKAQAIKSAEEIANSYATPYPNMVKELLITDYGFSETEAEYAVQHANIDWYLYVVTLTEMYVEMNNYELSEAEIEQYLSETLGYSQDVIKYALENSQIKKDDDNELDTKIPSTASAVGTYSYSNSECTFVLCLYEDGSFSFENVTIGLMLEGGYWKQDGSTIHFEIYDIWLKENLGEDKWEYFNGTLYTDGITYGADNYYKFYYKT